MGTKTSFGEDSAHLCDASLFAGKVVVTMRARLLLCSEIPDSALADVTGRGVGVRHHMPSFVGACTRDRLCCQCRRVAVPRGGARRVLADQPAAAARRKPRRERGARRRGWSLAGDVAGGRRRGSGKERGGVSSP